MNSASRLKIGLILGLQALAFASLQSCSVLLSSDATQCTKDADCQKFTATICDVNRRVCVPAEAPGLDGGAADAIADGTPDGTLGCLAASGCYVCAPTNDQQFLSSCTDSTCVPFDNRRLTNLNPDGTLKPLP